MPPTPGLWPQRVFNTLHPKDSQAPLRKTTVKTRNPLHHLILRPTVHLWYHPASPPLIHPSSPTSVLQRRQGRISQPVPSATAQVDARLGGVPLSSDVAQAFLTRVIENCLHPAHFPLLPQGGKFYFTAAQSHIATGQSRQLWCQFTISSSQDKIWGFSLWNSLFWFKSA